MYEIERKNMMTLADTIKGEINRMCVTYELTEFDTMCAHAKGNLDNLSKMIYEDRFKKDKPKIWWWTPVSVGLPSENEIVIASTDYDVYPEARYTAEDGWQWACDASADYWEELNGVTAWMHLPDIYKAKSEV